MPNLQFSDEELPERSQQSEKHPLFAAIANKNLSDLQHILTTTPDAKELRDEVDLNLTGLQIL